MLPLAERRASTRAIVTILVCEIALSAFFVSSWFPRETLIALERATGGWISVTLLASSVFGGIGVWLAATIGGQSLRALGWIARDLVPAAIVLVVLWLVLNACAWLAHDAPRVTDAFARGAWGRVFGPVFAQLVGTALMEETLYRAFVWRQLQLRFADAMPPMRAALAALVASQALFAFMHVPIRLYAGYTLDDMGGTMLMLFASGVVLAGVYAATRNLFVAVAVHALGNTPTLLVVHAGPSPGTVLLVACGVIGTVWPLARWWRGRTFVRDAVQA